MEHVDKDKQNIGIITFHFPYNAGAVLQCYALQTFLQHLGHKVHVINYRPWYHQNIYTPFRNPWQAAKEEYRRRLQRGGKWTAILGGIRYFLATIKSWSRCKAVLDCDKKFQAFINAHINETECFRSLKRLKAHPPKCDVLICGSDQLWNPDLTDGKYDYAYFLEFGNENVKKLSYAVGMTKYPEPGSREDKDLQKFEIISVRESSSYQYLKTLYGNKVFEDVDPTLLLMREDYEALIPQENLEDSAFVLTYVLPDQSGKIVLQKAEERAKQMGIRHINICGKYYEGMYDVYPTKCCGPEEFLWYIANASLVFTNSFHATVFSILFHKEFFAVPHEKTGNRISELLDRLKLKNRIIGDSGLLSKLPFVPINYAEVDKVLKECREISQKHLKEWL